MAAKENKTFQLELTLEEANTIIEALGHMPFMRVYRIIEKIHVQAQGSNSPKTTKAKKK